MSFRKTVARTMVTLLAGAALAAPASAAIDRQVLPTDGQFCYDAECSWEQVVNPGMTGLLSSLQLFGQGHALLRLAYGPAPVNFGWTALLDIDLAGPVDLRALGFLVEEGQPFVFELSNLFDADGTLAGVSLPPTPSQLYRSNNVDPYTSGSHKTSLAYVTMVEPVVVDPDPSPAPAPPTAALVLLGLAAMTAAARRKPGA